VSHREQIFIAKKNRDQVTSLVEMESCEEKCEVKWRHYESQCKRHGLMKMDVVRRTIRREAGTDELDLEYSSIGTLQCQIIFDALHLPPVTPLTEINLNGNHLEHFCCHSIASFIQMSMSLKKLTLEGCK
jgi:hypothetical protein